MLLDELLVMSRLHLAEASYASNLYPLDMYLMTLCKAGITANSTFSYFGAMLNIKKQIVCCPKMWYSAAYDDPDVYPDEWIKL